jgi:hypothetical protein
MADFEKILKSAAAGSFKFLKIFCDFFSGDYV